MRIAICKGALALGLLLAAGACGDDEHIADDTDDVAPDAEVTVDAPPVDDTLTAFVIAMIEDRTSDVTDAEPYATFSELEDDDADNDAAYSSLFE